MTPPAPAPIPGELVHPAYRPDIDGLRAVAVLSVVSFHAFPSAVPGGFAGVDVFFVISGFLISTILFGSLDRGSFSFVAFYSRRINRIFPALMLVLLACFAFGWVALLGDEFRDLGKHIAGGAAFIANFLFWNESGYFDNAAETKPLLHLWSLGIEEQYYIAWPLLLWVATRAKVNLLRITLVVAVLSFAFNAYQGAHDVVADFYSPQTRFWELMAGSILAYVTLHRQNRLPATRLHRTALSWTGAALIGIGLAVISRDRHFPGWWALLPVMGAVLVIAAGREPWFNRRVLSNPVVVWFGLISFPLYLWHWPLLSYARILVGATPPVEVRVALVALSVLLAWLTYRFVERPIRFGARRRPKALALLVVALAVGALGYGAYGSNVFDFRLK